MPNLAEEMYQAMKAAGGVGLSAIQVGVPDRMVVLDVGQGMEIYYNPVLTVAHGSPEPVVEGCLSTPGFFETMRRFKEVTVRHGLGGECEIHATGLRAHALQHEIEHLAGNMFVDHLKQADRSRAFGAMMKLKRTGFKKDLFR